MMEDENILPKDYILRERYKILRKIGGQEISNLYIARDVLKKKYWVIKELMNTLVAEDQREDAIRQFEFEAKLLLELRHPQLPEVEDFFAVDDKHYIIMEYLEGDELESIVKDSESFLDEVSVIELGIKICDALDYLHSQPHPIIFRALSPDNILITDDKQVKLVDFGISKIFNPRTKTISIAQSINPHFSPLEQYSTVSTDVRTDIYSLGATLYFAITRALPQDAIDRSIGNIPLKPPKVINPFISREFNDIILKAMETKKADRFQSAVKMKIELKQVYDKMAPKIPAVPKKEKKVTEKIEENVIEEAEKTDNHKEDFSTSDLKSVKKPTGKKSGKIFIIITALFFFVISCGGIYYFGRKFLFPRKNYFNVTLKTEAEMIGLKKFLESKDYKFNYKLTENSDPSYEKGYIIYSVFKGENALKEAEKVSDLLIKKSIKDHILSIREDMVIVILLDGQKKRRESDPVNIILDNHIFDAQSAEEKLDELSKKGVGNFSIEKIVFFAGNNEKYEFKVLLKDEKGKEEVETYLKDQNYNY